MVDHFEGTIPDSLWRLKISLNSGEKDYYIFPLEAIDDSIEKPTMDMSLPGQSYRNTPLMALSGQTKSVSISFAIWDCGLDKSGENGDDIVTVTEQLEYLDDNFYDPDFSAKWTLDLYRVVDGEKEQRLYKEDVDVIVERLDKPIIAIPSDRYVEGCRMELMVGEAIV